MGLDGVELVMNVEETFGVAIPDELAQKMRTVGDLYDHLLTQCTGDRRSVCLTSAAFYQLRQGICRTLHIERASVRPSTPIDNLVSGAGYRRFWARLRPAMSTLRLPSLGRPALLSHIAVHASDYAILVALASFPVILLAASQVGTLVVPLIAVEILAIAAWLALAERLARYLPRNFQTVGELARLVLTQNHAWFVERQKTWDENRIWEVLQSTVSNTLGVDLKAVTRQARFVDDLGVG